MTLNTKHVLVVQCILHTVHVVGSLAIIFGGHVPTVIFGKIFPHCWF